MNIAVIGGGIYGSSIAYFLKKLGDVDVTLFEKNDIGGTSTARSAGIVRHHYSNEQQIKIARRGREILEDLSTHVGHTGGFVNNGFLMMAGESNEEAFRQNVTLQQEIGIDVDILTPEEVNRYLPGFNQDSISVAAYEHEAGVADPYLVTTGFASRAAELGAEIRTNTPVVDLIVDDREITALQTESDVREIDYVVNATGPYGRDVAGMAGIEIPLSWWESKVVVLSTDTENTAELPGFADLHSAMYGRPEGEGQFLVGGFNDVSLERPTSTLASVTSEDLIEVGEWLEVRFPRFADARIVNDWSGVITAAPDWHQIIGRPRNRDNFFNALAGGGHGFKEAPGFAESIAETILGDRPTFDLSRYRLERFDEDDEMTSRYQSAPWLA